MSMKLLSKLRSIISSGKPKRLSNASDMSASKPETNIEVSENSNQSDIPISISNELVEYNHCTLCMIDIAGFTKWCMNQIPRRVVDCMYLYNQLIIEVLSRWNTLSKIELVGDCCLVIGAADDSDHLHQVSLDTIRFAYTMLQNVDKIQDIFSDQKIGIRIGIHIAHVFGVMISNPNKFQLFGNDINVCSRIMDRARINSIHISLKTVASTKGMCNKLCGPRGNMVRSKLLEFSYKGVGELYTYMFDYKTNKRLLYSEIRDATTNIEVVICTDWADFLDKLYMYYWINVGIESEYIKEDHREDLKNFKMWDNRTPRQSICHVRTEGTRIMETMSITDYETFSNEIPVLKFRDSLDLT